MGDQHARLDTLVTVVDGANFFRELHSVQTTASSGQAAYEGDDRGLAQLLVNRVLGTGAFSMTDAEKNEKWLKESRIGEHVPETEESGIRNFVYKRRLPFHPERLKRLLDDKESLPGVLRAKGFIWIATRPRFVGVISLVGSLR